jgi:hypothetical protein
MCSKNALECSRAFFCAWCGGFDLWARVWAFLWARLVAMVSRGAARDGFRPGWEAWSKRDQAEGWS